MDKLAISNIAWTGNNEKIFELLADLGVTGVEVAPGKVNGGWDALDVVAMESYRQACASYGLVIPSFQAFLFGKPTLQLLGDKHSFNELKEHIRFVADLAQVAGAKVLVFGAPKNRLLLDHAYDDGMKLAEERLSILAEICWANEVSIGLEAVPEFYGGEIIKSYKESARIVNTVRHPGLVFHLDTGCTFLNDDSISEAIKDSAEMMVHFHISEPKLSDFSDPEDYHSNAAAALNKKNYCGWHCIEMLETINPASSIAAAVKFVTQHY